MPIQDDIGQGPVVMVMEDGKLDLPSCPTPERQFFVHLCPVRRAVCIGGPGRCLNRIDADDQDALHPPRLVCGQQDFIRRCAEHSDGPLGESARNAAVTCILAHRQGWMLTRLHLLTDGEARDGKLGISRSACDECCDDEEDLESVKRARRQRVFHRTKARSLRRFANEISTG